MIKKIFIIFNLLLAIVFTWMLFALYVEIGYKGAEPPSIAETADAGIKRPALELNPGYRNIFGITSAETTKKPFKHGDGNGTLNELVSGDEAVRVQGIFITEDKRYAVLSIVNKKKKGRKTEEIKVTPGDSVRGFTVKAIGQGYVSLAGDTSESIDLKIFKAINEK